MFEYESEELKKEFIELVEFCNTKGIRCEFNDINEMEAEQEIIGIEEEGNFYFELTDYDECNIIDIRRAIEIKNDVINSRQEGHIYRSKNKYIVRVATTESVYTPYIKPIKATFKYNGKDYKVSLETESEEYYISLFINNQYGEYLPIVLDDDLFICIECKEGIGKNVEAILQRYIFEVDSLFGIQLFESPRPEEVEFDYEEEESAEDSRVIKEIEIDDNLTEILSIFNKAANIESIESKILNYTRVIEYASQTVIKKDLFESVLNKLSSDRVYNPDGQYILELEQIFKENSKYSKDKEAIKITVSQCCDVMNLKSYAPKFLKKINMLKIDSKKADQLEALAELGEAIADTRNMVSHAKTNYNKKGMECPNEQLFEFGQCVKVVAYQVVRWYARQSNTYLIK